VEVDNEVTTGPTWRIHDDEIAGMRERPIIDRLTDVALVASRQSAWFWLPPEGV